MVNLRVRSLWLRSLIVGLLTGLVGALLILTPPGVLFEEEVGLAWLFRVRGAVEPPPDVAIIAISGTTGSRLGLPKLPRDWPRTVHAGLVEGLTAHDVAVSVIDMDFSRIKSGFEDSMLALALAESDRTVLFERLVGRRQPLEDANGEASGWTWVEEKLSPAPVLANAATALAPFALPKLGQAAIQFWSFKASLGDLPMIPAVALQLYALPVWEQWRAVLAAAGASDLDALPAHGDAISEPAEVRRVMGRLRQMFLDDPELARRVRARLEPAQQAAADDPAAPLLRALAALYGGPRDRYLNFFGPPGTIRTIDYAKLVEPDPDSGAFLPVGLASASATGLDLRDRVVFVGYSDLYEPDQPDRFYTVFTGSDGIDLSGVEIMATAFANLLTDSTLRPANAAVSAALLLIFGLFTGFLAASLPALWAIPLTLAAAAVCAWVNQMAFNLHDLWLPVATPFLIQLPLALLLGLMSQYLLGRWRQQRMSEAISYYLPANVVRDLTEGQLEPGSVNKVVFGTCFATDMSGFSTLAETMTPGELAEFMNAYFDALATALKAHHVDVIEFHADTIMCAWLNEDIAKRRDAVRAAIAAVAAIEAFAEARGGLALNPRIGLQDGHFYVGHTGGGGRMTYSILGDPANTAARLESLNKYLGTHILAADSVLAGLDELLVRPLGQFQVKGRTEATALAQVLALISDADLAQLQLCQRFAEALAAFRAHRWQHAGELFEAIMRDWPDDGPARFYYQRCQEILAAGASEPDLEIIKMDMK